MAVAVAGERGSSGRWGRAAGVEEGSLGRSGMVAAAAAGRSSLAAVADRDVGRHLRSCGGLVLEGRRSSRRGLGGCCFRRRRIGRRTGHAGKVLEGGVQCGQVGSEYLEAASLGRTERVGTVGRSVA